MESNGRVYEICTYRGIPAHFHVFWCARSQTLGHESPPPPPSSAARNRAHLGQQIMALRFLMDSRDFTCESRGLHGFAHGTACVFDSLWAMNEGF